MIDFVRHWIVALMTVVAADHRWAEKMVLAVKFVADWLFQMGDLARWMFDSVDPLKDQTLAEFVEVMAVEKVELEYLSWLEEEVAGLASKA